MARKVDILSVPVGGINVATSYDKKPKGFAEILTNYIPENGVIKLRNGFSSHATGLGGAVKTLAVHNGQGGTQTMLAAANGNIYTISGGVGTSKGSGFSVDTWQTIQFKNIVFFVNGTDAPQKYNGSTLTTTGFTGPSSINDFINVSVYKERLYFVEEGKMSFWYAGVGAITGACTEEDVSLVTRHGGYVVYAGSLTRETGAGIQDFFVIATSEGEIIFYSGDSPADAAWQVAGRLRVAGGLGYRSLVSVGGDIAAITKDGVFSLRQALSAATSQTALTSLTEAIKPIYDKAITYYGTNTGWQLFNFVSKNYVIVNVPTTSNSKAFQYLMTRSGAWCKIEGYDAICWCSVGDSAYFGTSAGTIMKAFNGANDNGARIKGEVAWAYSAAGTIRNKRYLTLKLITRGAPDLEFAVVIDVDFQSSKAMQTVNTDPSDESLWDVAQWDISPWATGDARSIYKYAISGYGSYASLHLKGFFGGAIHQIESAELTFEEEGYL